MPKRPTSPADLPKSVPVFPLSGALLLPFSHRPLNIFERAISRWLMRPCEATG